MSREPAGSPAVWRALSDLAPVGPDLLAVDWATTPLGPPERWPLSLQTTVTALVGSRFSMWMAWGPQLTFFCNDAYRRDTLGVKYPWALGRPAEEVWSEIWPEIWPRIESVLTTGAATWDEGLLLFLERAGFVEETYHTFSYSPLRDDGGGRGGHAVRGHRGHRAGGWPASPRHAARSGVERLGDARRSRGAGRYRRGAR